ncbi:hypothetical protein UY3_15712 [Chelonia mydas]|uniref:Uncharacterized protein n=1 Tax=Chelonia mydas TaxID=8469 RepID=M7BG45_CHEMY|nr:hypothetical protein UY3_15712 [Chelonia mydas]
MARGQQKIQSQQKNAKKQAGQKKKQGHDQKAAAKAALIYTCTVCRSCTEPQQAGSLPSPCCIADRTFNGLVSGCSGRKLDTWKTLLPLAPPMLSSTILLQQQPEQQLEDLSTEPQKLEGRLITGNLLLNTRHYLRLWVAMAALRTNAELLDLISIWGEEAVQSQLRSSHRNYDIYGQISQCMTERGHDRDIMQCRVKVKKLQNAYHKVREANCCSGPAPTSCWLYKEMDAILCGDPISTVKSPLDTSGAQVLVEVGPSQEEEILD